MISSYCDFLESKVVRSQPSGFHYPLENINGLLFEWQRAIVQWALKQGRAALFMDTGTGKTATQLEYARIVSEVERGNILIVTPLAVARQTQREGAKFGIPVTVCRAQFDVRPGINITNYEMLQHFDLATFIGVILDESSCLKAFMGKTKRMLVESCRDIPYRLCCTATPAPNDHMEIGNHAEFLGIMPSNEMLARWFINDTMQNGHYRLKGHAAADFWDWVASWAVSMRRPSDIGYSDEGYCLPELCLHQVRVEVDTTTNTGGALFRTPELSATNIHKEMRLTNPDRCRAVAELVNGNDDTWAVWCNTNYEADELKRLIHDAIEVRGSHTIVQKETRIDAFTTGQERVIIGKPSQLGFGLNWQHCHKTAFVGLSYSFEEFYQAVRRVYRFGQQHPVDAYLITASTEGPVLQTVMDKMAAHGSMMDNMTAARGGLSLDGRRVLRADAGDAPVWVPQWLREAA